ncbi:MAG: response regulator transcription factor [Deltaproteobacteria bacterium]
MTRARRSTVDRDGGVLPIGIHYVSGDRRSAGFRLATVALTPQQERVLRLIAQGHSTKQIAHHLQIAERTAQWHVSRLMDLFDSPSRAALVYKATRSGVFSDPIPAIRRR